MGIQSLEFLKTRAMVLMLTLMLPALCAQGDTYHNTETVVKRNDHVRIKVAGNLAGCLGRAFCFCPSGRNWYWGLRHICNTNKGKYVCGKTWNETKLSTRLSPWCESNIGAEPEDFMKRMARHEKVVRQGRFSGPIGSL